MALREAWRRAGWSLAVPLVGRLALVKQQEDQLAVMLADQLAAVTQADPLAEATRAAVPAGQREECREATPVEPQVVERRAESQADHPAAAQVDPQAAAQVDPQAAARVAPPAAARVAPLAAAQVAPLAAAQVDPLAAARVAPQAAALVAPRAAAQAAARVAPQAAARVVPLAAARVAPYRSLQTRWSGVNSRSRKPASARATSSRPSGPTVDFRSGLALRGRSRSR